MKKKARILSVVLTMILVLLSVVGCSEQKDNHEKKEKKQSESQEEQKKPTYTPFDVKDGEWVITPDEPEEDAQQPSRDDVLYDKGEKNGEWATAKLSDDGIMTVVPVPGGLSSNDILPRFGWSVDKLNEVVKSKSGDFGIPVDAVTQFIACDLGDPAYTKAPALKDVSQKEQEYALFISMISAGDMIVGAYGIDSMTLDQNSGEVTINMLGKSGVHEWRIDGGSTLYIDGEEFASLGNPDDMLVEAAAEFVPFFDLARDLCGNQTEGNTPATGDNDDEIEVNGDYAYGYSYPDRAVMYPYEEGSGLKYDEVIPNTGYSLKVVDAVASEALDSGSFPIKAFRSTVACTLIKCEAAKTEEAYSEHDTSFAIYMTILNAYARTYNKGKDFEVISLTADRSATPVMYLEVKTENGKDIWKITNDGWWINNGNDLVVNMQDDDLKSAAAVWLTVLQEARSRCGYSVSSSRTDRSGSGLAAYDGIVNHGGTANVEHLIEAYYGCSIKKVADNGSSAKYEKARITMENGKTCDYFYTIADDTGSISDSSGTYDTIWTTWK